jgi:hypothetical protein
MRGDKQDMLARLKAVLPARWFPDDTPMLDGLLSGLAAAWSWCYDLLQYVRLQTRIATATDVWLDVIAQDFFGPRLTRDGQSDDALRRRIRLELVRERGTRSAVASVLQDLTGRAPLIFEPARTTDTGGYGGLGQTVTGLGYGQAGGWGSLNLSFQCFVTAFRPQSGGIATVAGWCSQAGGYGAGAIEYASLEMIQSQVADSSIYAAVADVLPVTAIAWTCITN